LKLGKIKRLGLKMLFNIKHRIKTSGKNFYFSQIIMGLLFALSTFNIQAESITTLDNIVAIVNEDVITQLELQDQFNDVVENLKQKKVALPPANILVGKVLDRMILERIQLELAQRTGIKVDDTTLSRAINSIAAQNKLSVSEFREQLAYQGVDFRTFREEVKKQVILKRLIQRNVVNKITITDQEIENFLFNVNKQGGIEQSYHLKYILIRVPEGSSSDTIQDAQEKATDIVKEIRTGKDFSDIAVAVSDGQNALEGGDLGWRKAGEVPTVLVSVVQEMQAGEVSDPIRDSNGFHIVTMVDIKGAQSHIVTQTHARHILIKPTIVDDAERVKKRLNQIRSRIINGEDFGTMAQAYSDDTSSATKGGDLGWFKEGAMVAQFEVAMNELQLGEVSHIVQTNFGYHIIEVLGRRSHDDADELIKQRAEKILKNRKITEQTEEFYRKIRDEAYVKILEDNS